MVQNFLAENSGIVDQSSSNLVQNIEKVEAEKLELRRKIRNKKKAHK